MRYSTALTAAFAATAIAGPLNVKRAYVTEISYVTVTVTVYGEEPTPTPTPAAIKSYTPAPKPKSSSKSSVAVYVAPSSSAPVYVAPSSSKAPVYTPPASSKAATSAAAVAAPAATGYQAVVLRHHNVHRANHSAPDLVWNQTLADKAYSWAAGCQFKHNADGFGQNLAASAPNANVSAQLSEGWYNGEAPHFAPYYNQASPAVSMETFETYGHFTQMVWKSTTSMGCATYDCRGASLGMWYTVCNYYPPGNYGGQYANNVGNPLNHPTCHWDD